MGVAVSDTANVIAGYVAELEAKRVALRLQTEAAEHSEQECWRLSGLLKEARAEVESLLTRAQVAEDLLARTQALIREDQSP